MSQLARSLALLLSLALLPGCNDRRRADPVDVDEEVADDDDTTDVADDDDATDPEPETCVEGATSCLFTDFRRCEQGEWTTVEECADQTPICHDQMGCLACAPGSSWCEDDDIVVCADDGMGTDLVESCEDGESCVAGACQDACDAAEAVHSYLGCRFLAVSTSNAVGSGFDNDFGIVIGNGGGHGPAAVTVSRGGVTMATETVAEGQTVAITLPMVEELKEAQTSAVVPTGAYEVTTSVPVAAYQFSPLHYIAENVASASNDASLLLPEHTLTGDYMVNTLPTYGAYTGAMGGMFEFYPGFAAIAATQDGTTVVVTSSATTADGYPASLVAGEQVEIELQRGDVLQIMAEDPQSWNCAASGWTESSIGGYSYCLVTSSDLTGTVVAADAPVAVFAGHRCRNVPFDTRNCDHLEEASFPVQTWGSLYLMTAPAHTSGVGVNAASYRVLARLDGTQVSFAPEVHGTVTLNAGEFIDFVTDEDFAATASNPIQITHAMLGQGQVDASALGDPALGSGVPWVQVRSTYSFHTPDTYVDDYINVVSPTGTAISLDGAMITGWEAVGDGAHEVARVAIEPGSHLIESTDEVGFGITTYGYAPYTSYLYPGGMNFVR